MLTTQGNPPVATALPIAAPPKAMTHIVMARCGPPVLEIFYPPVVTTKWIITGKTTGIRSRIIEKPLEQDLKLPKNHWFKSEITEKSTARRSEITEKPLK